MVKFVWFSILMLFKLNSTLPADVTTAAIIPERDIGSNSTNIYSTSTDLIANNKNKECKFIDFDKVSSEIKHAVRRFEEVNTENDNSLPKISKLTNGKPVLLIKNAESDIAKGAVAPDQRNMKDLKKFDQYVISKKNPYAELGGFRHRSISLSSNIAPSENQPKPPSHFFGDQSISQISDDDVQNIEIVSRGLTGFEIPIYKHHESKSTNATSDQFPIPDEKKIPHSDVESIVDKLKKLINEYEENRRHVK